MVASLFLSLVIEQMDPAVCLMYDFHQIIDQAFKNIQFASQSHIVHSLGIVRSQSDAHTTGQKEPIATLPCRIASIPVAVNSPCLLRFRLTAWHPTV